MAQTLLDGHAAVRAESDSRPEAQTANGTNHRLGAVKVDFAPPPGGRFGLATRSNSHNTPGRPRTVPPNRLWHSFAWECPECHTTGDSRIGGKAWKHLVFKCLNCGFEKRTDIIVRLHDTWFRQMTKVQRVHPELARRRLEEDIAKIRRRIVRENRRLAMLGVEVKAGG